MAETPEVLINSEIGELQSVILHRPGSEVQNMTPETVQKALYSDILNLPLVRDEYDPFQITLSKLTRTFEVKDLLNKVLSNKKAKENLLRRICRNEDVPDILPDLLSTPPNELSDLLVQGVPVKKDTLTKYLAKNYHALAPLHNFFFMRDAAVVINDKVLISPMANPVRERESMIMQAIFRHHPMFHAETLAPDIEATQAQPFCIEGGDILVAREDILIIGQGARTSTRGIDYLIEYFKAQKKTRHIIVKELPYKPESFIHLDMVFTFLDKDTCMAFKPLILDASRFLTIVITIDNGKVLIREADSLLGALKKLGIDLKPICCGGNSPSYMQQREQWHSGANFFCIGPGKVIGYDRNMHTIDALNQNGFAVISAEDVAANKIDPRKYSKYVITINGAELSRGGGGCRCMTMPVKRKNIDW